MAIIKCQNCGNDVSDKAKECPHCQAIINDTNGIENILNNFKIDKETVNNGSNVTSNKRIYNKVATKFNFVVWIIKALGYFAGIISLIVCANNGNFGIGLVICIITCVATWLSTLLFEAISEALQLLEDIKNK